jgi:stearoyl-CoA desaturase (Delta-9 desaturase)
MDTLVRTTGPTPPSRTTAGVVAATVIVAGLPVLAGVGAVALWRPPTWAELGTAVAMYALAGFGISLGWHRLFTHRGFKARSGLRVGLAVAGSLAFEGGLAAWVANHRVHHAHTDTEGDPHSPWNRSSRWRGLAHAHVGWLTRPGADESRYARDVVGDPTLRAVSRWWWAIALAGLLTPAVAAAAVGGWRAGLGMVVWAGLVRVVVLHHVTWSVNSLCHVVGSRQHDTTDQSRNLAVLSLVSFGESWHNNHHFSPRTARHGTGRFQLDPSAALLWLWERTGLVSDVRWDPRPTPG